MPVQNTHLVSFDKCNGRFSKKVHRPVNCLLVIVKPKGSVEGERGFQPEKQENPWLKDAATVCDKKNRRKHCSIEQPSPVKHPKILI